MPVHLLIPYLKTAWLDRVSGCSNGPVGVPPRIYLEVFPLPHPGIHCCCPQPEVSPCIPQRAFLLGKYREVDLLRYWVRACPICTFIAKFTSNTDAGLMALRAPQSCQRWTSSVC